MPKAVNGRKVCSKCGERKPVSEFNKDRSTADGLFLWCKACVRISRQQRHQRLKDEGPTIVRTTKICPQCGEEKPVSEFYKDRTSADGYCCQCKACKAIYDAASYAEHREERQASGRAYYTTHQEARQAYGRAYGKRYYKEHRAEVDAWHREYFATDVGQAVQRGASKRYRESDKGRTTATKHRALKAGVLSDVTPEGLAQLFVQHPVCVYCGHEFEEPGPFERTLDHVVPYSRGGQNTLDNLVFACRRCNTQKNDRLPEEWVDRWYERVEVPSALQNR